MSETDDPLARKAALLEKQAQARKEKQEEADSGEENEGPIVEEAAPVVSMREDMISNAVKFLSHPNVQKTPLVRRVAFLEQKGLTNEEITEALRRNGSPGGNSSTPLVQSNTIQPQAPPPVPQRVQYITAPPPPPPSMFKTVATSVILTLGAAGGIAWLYNTFIKKQIQRNAEQEEHKPLTRELLTETPEKPKETSIDNSLQASMSELVQVMKSQQSEVKDTLKMVHTVLNTPDNKSVSKSTDQINVKELTNAITELQSLIKNTSSLTPSSTPQNTSVGSNASGGGYNTTPLRTTKANPLEHSGTNYSASAGSSPAEQKKSSLATGPTSFQDVMKMVQAGETPPNVKDIDDSPLNPATVVSPSATEKPLKPWEKRRQQKTSKINVASAEKPAYLGKFLSSNSSEDVSKSLSVESLPKEEKVEKEEKEETAETNDAVVEVEEQVEDSSVIEETE